jgi:heterodisulfide reductase subunit A-like polyferredoxin
MALEIDNNNCDRCGTCVGVCPCNALVLAACLEVDRKRCTVCGTCVALCPAGALSVAGTAS